MASVGLYIVNVALDQREVVEQVSELHTLGVFVEYMNATDTLVLTEVDFAQANPAVLGSRYSVECHDYILHLVG